MLSYNFVMELIYVNNYLVVSGMEWSILFDIFLRSRKV